MRPQIYPTRPIICVGYTQRKWNQHKKYKMYMPNASGETQLSFHCNWACRFYVVCLVFCCVEYQTQTRYSVEYRLKNKNGIMKLIPQVWTMTRLSFVICINDACRFRWFPLGFHSSLEPLNNINNFFTVFLSPFSHNCKAIEIDGSFTTTTFCQTLEGISWWREFILIQIINYSDNKLTFVCGWYRQGYDEKMNPNFLKIK